jgi:hypothetical protein
MTVLIFIFIWIIISNIIANKIFKFIFNYHQREPYEQYLLDTALGHKIDRYILTLIIIFSPLYIKAILSYW